MMKLEIVIADAHEAQLVGEVMQEIAAHRSAMEEQMRKQQEEYFAYMMGQREQEPQQEPVAVVEPEAVKVSAPRIINEPTTPTEQEAVAALQQALNAGVSVPAVRKYLDEHKATKVGDLKPEDRAGFIEFLGTVRQQGASLL